jgi:hypothetical protein
MAPTAVNPGVDQHGGHAERERRLGAGAIDRAEHRLAVPPDRVETGCEPALHERDKWLAVLAANRAWESDEQRRWLRRRTLSSQATCRLRSIYEKSGMSLPAMVLACV